MTLPGFCADRLRRSHPGWHIWRVGKRWWAKRKQSNRTAYSYDPDVLDAELAKQDQADALLQPPGGTEGRP